MGGGCGTNFGARGTSQREPAVKLSSPRPRGSGRRPRGRTFPAMSSPAIRPGESTAARFEALVLATSTLIGELSLEGVLQQVVQVAAEVIGAHYAAIGVLGPDGRVLESFTTHGITPEQRALIGPPPRGHGILGLVIREARPIRLPDLARHPDSYGFPPHHPPMHSFLGVPIVGRRGVFGNLYLTEKIGGEVVHRRGRAHRGAARRQHGGGGGKRPAARGERPAAGGGAAAPPHPGAVLRDGEPRAAERARGRLRVGRDAGPEEGSGDGAQGGLRGARLRPAGRSASSTTCST